MALPHLHFRIPDVAGFPLLVGGRRKRIWGLEAHGRASLTEHLLVLQLTLESASQKFREVREVSIPVQQIDSFEVQRRWLKPPVVLLRVRDLHLLAEVPGGRGGELLMDIAREDRLHAEELVSSAVLLGSEIDPAHDLRLRGSE